MPAASWGAPSLRSLAGAHEIVSSGSKSGDVRIDIADPASIVAGLKAAGPLDAVACAAGAVNFRPMSAISVAPVESSVYGLGIVNKLMGQVNLTLAARDVLREGGSITLIAGVLSEHPIVAGSAASMVNGAVEAFARAASVELPRGIRINAVSPTVFEELMGGYAPSSGASIPCPSRGPRGRSPAASRVGRPVRSTRSSEVSAAHSPGPDRRPRPRRPRICALARSRFAVSRHIHDGSGFVGWSAIARACRWAFRISPFLVIAVFALAYAQKRWSTRLELWLRNEFVGRGPRAAAVGNGIVLGLRRLRRIVTLGADGTRGVLPDRNPDDRVGPYRQSRHEGSPAPAAPHHVQQFGGPQEFSALVSFRRRLPKKLQLPFGRGFVRLLDGRAGCSLSPRRFARPR